MNNLRDDLRWYLLDEHIEDLKKMGHPEQKANIYTNKNNWLNVYYKWHPVISSIEFSAKIGYPVLSSIGKNRSKDNIIITDKVLRYSSVINELSKLYKLTFLGGYPRNIQLMIKKGILYYPYYPSNLIESLLKNDYNYLSSYIEDLKDLLMKLKPKAIILYYDHLLTERAIVLAAKELEIPTIEIQHGIYNENQIITGKYAKYLFVWGEFFRDMYIKNKLRSRDEIKVLGYPLHITPNI
jgi:hypothetical protein